MRKIKQILPTMIGFLICIFGLLFLYWSPLTLFVTISDIQKGISLKDRWEASQGEEQALSEVKRKVDQIPIPVQTVFLSEYTVSNICCGQGESYHTWPLVTRLYESGLSKEEIRKFYEGYLGGLYFVDEAIKDYPDRKVYIPCYPHNLFIGHNIPAKLPQDKNLYIITGSSIYTPPNPKILYCD